MFPNYKHPQSPQTSQHQIPNPNPTSTIYIPRTHPGPPLRTIRLQRYTTPIQIFHYLSSYLPLPAFRKLLTWKTHGYIDTLLGPDPLPNTKLPHGDEIPDGCIEVAYLDSVFTPSGSALGFRTGKDMVQWLCFDRAVDVQILFKTDVEVKNSTSADMRMLFDHVASLAKYPGQAKQRRANVEYKGWWRSLSTAELRPRRVRLEWRGSGKGLREEYEKARLEREEQVVWGEREMEVIGRREGVGDFEKDVASLVIGVEVRDLDMAERTADWTEMGTNVYCDDTGVEMERLTVLTNMPSVDRPQ